MARLFQLLARFLLGSGSARRGGKNEAGRQNMGENQNIVSAGEHDSDCIAIIHARLQQTSKLLVYPTPQRIREAALLLEQAQEALKGVQSAADNVYELPIERLAGRIAQLEFAMRVVKQLLEGALRVQWAQLRKITVISQSYTRGGRISQWQPGCPKVDLQV